MKDNIKAIAYVTGGFLTAVVSVIAIISMYFSSTFLPVYVKGTYVIGNQILRYEVYAILAAIVGFSMWVACYGGRYLIKRIHRIKRRR